MLKVNTCVICNHEHLELLFSKKFEAPTGKLSDYAANVHKFRNVLTADFLDGRFGGSFEYRVCQNCGFVFSSPRPNEEEMEKKYDAIVAYQTTEKSPFYDLTFDNSTRRSRDLVKLLEKHISLEETAILDFGGAEGRILQAFNMVSSRGVLDFERRNLVEGVEYLGQTFSDVSDRKFDVISACHVVEHLVKPKALLREMAERLTEKGLIYVEVPSELRKGYTGHLDFITHINVFSAASLEYLLVMCGFEVLELKTSSKANNNGWELVIYAIARLAKNKSTLPRNCQAVTMKALRRRWLYPRIIGRLRTIWHSRVSKLQKCLSIKVLQK